MVYCTDRGDGIDIKFIPRKFQEKEEAESLLSPRKHQQLGCGDFLWSYEELGEHLSTHHSSSDALKGKLVLQALVGWFRLHVQKQSTVAY